MQPLCVRGTTMDRHTETPTISRRTFLTATSAVLVGAALGGLAPYGTAAQRHPQRGGVLQYGSRTDIAGLDAHRHNQNHQIHATAAMYDGLTDIDQRGNLVPSLAESWEPNKELSAWTFRLRKGVLFHNGWETDAAGHSLPYLDEIIAKPKREDSVRLTALRTGQVQLIDDMAQADVERFMKEHGAKYNTWRWHSGGNYIVFNWRRGVFQD